MENTEKAVVGEVTELSGPEAEKPEAALNIGLTVPLAVAKCLCPEEHALDGSRIGDGTAATCEKCAGEVAKIVQVLLQGFERALAMSLRKREGNEPRIITASNLRNLKTN